MPQGGGSLAKTLPRRMSPCVTPRRQTSSTGRLAAVCMRESRHVPQLNSTSYSSPEATGVIPTSSRMFPAVLDHSCFLGTSIAAFPKPQLCQPRLCFRTSVVPPIVARQETRTERVQKRHKSIRNKVEGRPERPRLAVYRSNNHIYAQVIDDSAGSTLVAASTLSKDIRQTLNGGGGGNQDAAQLVGKRIAELCLEKNIEKVCFDRGGNIYHGRVKALADAAREGGLLF